MVEPVSSDLLAPTEAGSIPSPRWQAAGAAVVLVAAGMALARCRSGRCRLWRRGPNFLPGCAPRCWLCAACCWCEALTGGYRQAADGVARAARGAGALCLGYRRAALNAALIETLGFIWAARCAMRWPCRGLRRANGQQGKLAPRALAVDVFTGLAIAAPVFWLFTQFLAINLPGLTNTGWL